MSWLARLLRREPLPDGFTGDIADDERVLAVADISPSDGGGYLVASSRGVWVPAGPAATRRMGWHVISKATWTGGALVIVEAEEIDRAGDAVLLVDRPSRRFGLPAPGALPAIVRERVERSIRSRHRYALPGGQAWFVQRKVVGRDGYVLQVRADPGVDMETVRAIAAGVADRLRAGRPVT